MTPDRIRGWLRTPSQGAKRVALVVETANGVQPVADWSREQATTPDPEQDDVADQITTQSQEYTEGEDERTKFYIRWLGKDDRVLNSITHHCKPGHRTDGVSPTISDASIIKELLTALREKDRQLNESLVTVTRAFKETIQMATSREKELDKMLAATRRKLPDPAEESHLAVVVSDEEKLMHASRAAAWDKLSDKLPEIFDLGIAALAQKFLNPADEQEVGDAAE